MDESTVNKEGSGWPPVLKFVVCQLLLEITAYIRETYKAIPKVGTSGREREGRGKERGKEEERVTRKKMDDGE